MKVLKQALAVPVLFGGHAHTGWLPAGSAHPEPTPLEVDVLDVRILDAGGGYVLEWFPHEGRGERPRPPKAGDLWFERIEEALTKARESLGVHEGDWETVAEGPADAHKRRS